MKQVTTQVIILKRLNFGEADRILTVITLEGKMSLLAKGVRRPKSKLAGGLELFCVSDVTYIDGKSDLKTVVSTKLSLHCKHIPTDIDRSMVGYDMLKAINTFADHTEEADMFSILQRALQGLNDMSIASEIVQAWFTMQLTLSLGSGINLEKPMRANAFSEQQMYSFSYDDMAFFTDENGIYTPNSIKFLRLVERADRPAKLLVIEGAEGFCTDLAPLMKNLLVINRA